MAILTRLPAIVPSLSECHVLGDPTFNSCFTKARQKSDKMVAGSISVECSAMIGVDERLKCPMEPIVQYYRVLEFLNPQVHGSKSGNAKPIRKGGATEVTRLVRAEVSRCRSTDPGTPTRREGRTFLNHKEDPIMPSNRPIHTEASSRVPKGADTEKPHALWNLSGDQSDSANMRPTALSHSTASLMESIVDPTNIEKAWKKVRSNGGAPGPDAMTIKAFPKHFREHWPMIRQQLLEGTYEPAPARRKSISKPDGGQRDLGIPTVTGKSTPEQSAFGLR